MQYGHKILFDLCVKKFDELKRKGVSKKHVASAVVRYALKNWISHILEGLEDVEKLEGFVDSYLIDLEVMFASVVVDVNVALINLSSLESHEMSKHMSACARVIVKKLYSLIRKFAFSLQKHPQTFLQNIVNEGEEQLSSKASDLLQTRYKNIFYFQSNNYDRKNDAIEVRCYLSGQIQSISVSPNHDYVVCAYKRGIELFSLATGMSEWKKESFSRHSTNQFFSLGGFVHNVVFHPHENLIFPGRLDTVLTLQGELTTGLFHFDKDSCVFSICCFSMDGSKMVTHYGYLLFVWNVSNGSMERRISCNKLCSLSFTGDGNFLGTSAIHNVFSVYDVMNDYKVNHKRIKGKSQIAIVCTFDHNSWLCSVDRVLRVVSHNRVLSSDFGSLKGKRLPGNDHSSRELQRFLQHPEKSWLSKVRKNVMSDISHFDARRYILVGDKNVLFFSYNSSIINLFSIEGLAQTEQSASNVGKFVFSNMSLNGDFVYFSNPSTKNFTVCKLPSQDKYSRSLTDKLHFLVVRDGVIFYSKGNACIPELWNSDVTECLSSFDQLTDTIDCLSVSDEVIASVCYQTGSKCRIIFLNVLTKEIVKEMNITENTPSGFEMDVHACSINFYVLAKQSNQVSLWKDGKKVDGWENVFLKSVDGAEFSPGGNRLAVLYFHKISVFDVASKRNLAEILIDRGNYDYQPVFKFFDNENLLYSSENNMLYSININHWETTWLDIGDEIRSISVCRGRNIVCVGFDCSTNFELITVFPPRRSHTS